MVALIILHRRRKNAQWASGPTATGRVLRTPYRHHAAVRLAVNEESAVTEMTPLCRTKKTPAAYMPARSRVNSNHEPAGQGRSGLSYTVQPDAS